MPGLALTIGLALALAALAALVRSGSHSTWLVAISAESILVAVGLFEFVYSRYVGGTLLGLITLGTLLHPTVARAFAPVADPAAEPLPDPIREPAA